MEILGGEGADARLPYTDLAESIREVALERASGAVHAPSRMALPCPGSGLLVM